MRNKPFRSKEEARAAIEKEIAAITTDIERLRTLALHEHEPELAHVSHNAASDAASPAHDRGNGHLN